jgi:Ca2+-binding RTX toxin-like protein
MRPSLRASTAAAAAALVVPLLMVIAGPAHAGLVAQCGGLDVTISGDDSPNNLDGTEGNDVIWAGGGADTVYGEGGNDIICGGDGDDLLYGGVACGPVNCTPADDNLEDLLFFYPQTDGVAV